MATIPTIKKRGFSIYLIIGAIGLLAVLAGFSKTFFIPMSQGQFVAPLVVHVHGAFAFAWVILYIVQTALIHNDSIHYHKYIGWAGAIIAAGIALTMLPVGVFQVERDLKLGLGDTAVSALLGTVTSAIVFVTLISFGFYYRSNPRIHKPLMLLATIFVLWPAWFRFRHFFPSVPRPDIWFGLVLSESLIVIAWITEWRRYGRVNKTLLYVGALIIIETSIEVLMFDTPGWRVLARGIYSILT